MLLQTQCVYASQVKLNMILDLLHSIYTSHVRPRHSWLKSIFPVKPQHRQNQQGGSGCGHISTPTLTFLSGQSTVSQLRGEKRRKGSHEISRTRRSARKKEEKADRERKRKGKGVRREEIEAAAEGRKEVKEGKLEASENRSSQHAGGKVKKPTHSGCKHKVTEEKNYLQ